MPESAATYSDGSAHLEATSREQARALGADDRQDAFSAGIVKGSAERSGEALSRHDGPSGRGRAGFAEPSPAGAGKPKAKSPLAAQAKGNLKRAIADAATSEADDSEELSGVERASSTVRGARSVISRHFASKKASAASKAKGPLKGATRHARLGAFGHSAVAKARHTAASQASAGAAKAAADAGGKGAVVGAVSSIAVPVAGVFAAIMAFLLAVLAVSQIVSALFGFWENEASKASLEGLPPYITYEMVEEALACQEEYGHPAGCTIAQIIVESGQGDHLSGLATQDHNLFGMKWSSSYALCEEVAGKSSWKTGEEYGGEQVTVTADFISFIGDAECIRFRSRVFLQAERYASNALIREAIANHDSGKMAEGLKDAGWATSSSYVESLKSVMETYNLYRFDGMSLEDFRSGALSADAIVSAAYSQLGVPYVWGGTTPGVGLDCSGLTQYCYKQAGISIPRNTEAQYAQGKKIALSEAQPGDILYRMGHVGIYIGGDQYIHAPHRGEVVMIASGISSFTCALSYR
ncbi:NlpC/P60 family protein [Enteroscipio rubneri]|uniref:NlpC/P60 family protein n=1 Tax=Enteroscipio rubneri TaxID=2070686 RepID=UPI0032097083